MIFFHLHNHDKACECIGMYRCIDYVKSGFCYVWQYVSHSGIISFETSCFNECSIYVHQLHSLLFKVGYCTPTTFFLLIIYYIILLCKSAIKKVKIDYSEELEKSYSPGWIACYATMYASMYIYLYAANMYVCVCVCVLL